MKKPRKQTNQQRREFLRTGVTASASVVVAAAIPAVATSAITDDVDDAKKKSGYQLSQHVLDYYKTCAR